MALSKRSSRATLPMPDYFVKVIASFSDQHSDDNPGGYINLSVAQNTLTSAMVAGALSAAPPIPKEVLTYTALSGDPPCLAVMVRFIAEHITRQPVRAEELVFTCGASGALDLISFALCDAGEAMLIVGPGYAGFENDAESRAGVRIAVAQLDADAGYAVSASALERGWAAAGGAESGIRFVVVSSPGNPTGEVLSAQTITEIVEWARRRALHVVFDELYALSVHGDTPFRSVAEVLGNELGDDVHVLWALSKDFSASGLRFGVLLTHAAEFRKRVTRASLFVDVSRVAQWAVQHMLADDAFVNRFLAENRRALREAYTKIAAWFEEDGIPYIPAQAGFFVWCNLGKWMVGGPSAEAEMELWDRILECKVILSPGSQCFAADFGWFRVCFAAVSLEQLEIGWSRVRMNVLS